MSSLRREQFKFYQRKNKFTMLNYRPGRVSSSFFTSGTGRATIVTNLVMNEERTGKCLRHVKLIDGHLWHRYSVTVNQVMVIGVVRKSFKVMTSTWPIGTLGSVVSLLAATIFLGIMIETTSSGMSNQLRDIYSICGYCWNVVTYKWKVHNHLICRKVSFLTGHHCQFWGWCQGMKQN